MPLFYALEREGKPDKVETKNSVRPESDLLNTFIPYFSNAYLLPIGQQCLLDMPISLSLALLLPMEQICQEGYSDLYSFQVKISTIVEMILRGPFQ
jgi:hypothetical protein